MAELARQGGTDVEVSKFEDWDPAGRLFDTVIAAQAWHWVDPLAGAAKAATVLRPGGRLAVFWNAFEPPEQLKAAFAEVFRRVQPDYTRDEWLDLVPTTGGFSRHPREIQEQLLAGLGVAVDAVGGTFTMAYDTIASTAVRR